MARRKTLRAARRRHGAKRGGTSRPRTRSAGAARKKSGARKSTARPARVTARKSARLRKAASAKQARLRKASATQARPRKASARQARGASAKQARLRKASARQASKPTRKTATRPLQTIARPRSAAPPHKPARAAFVARKAPALDRERRIVRDDDLVPTPPSSLDMDRSASAVRTGRRELHERFVEHTETSPAITGGDIDADWESAYSVGDEAPGGDSPTPDQDIVDDIGRAVGVEYEDNEELKGETKIKERDRKRWELDPASSEDYNDR